MVLRTGLDQLLAEVPVDSEFPASAVPTMGNTDRRDLTLRADGYGIDVATLLARAAARSFSAM